MAPLELVASTEKSCGTEITGGSTSLTVTDCADDALFPDASVAVQVMDVAPIGYGASTGSPSLREADTLTPGQLSEASGPLRSTEADARP